MADEQFVGVALMPGAVRKEKQSFFRKIDVTILPRMMDG